MPEEKKKKSGFYQIQFDHRFPESFCFNHSNIVHFFPFQKVTQDYYTLHLPAVSC